MHSAPPHDPEARFDSEFNWVWFAECRPGRAVEVLAPGDPPDRRLERLFDRVDRCRAGSGRLELSAGDAAADAVILRDLLPRLADGAAGRARRGASGPVPPEAVVLAECRRVLRDGGMVQFAVDNSAWHRNLRRRLDPRHDGFDPSVAASPAEARSWLRTAGFRSPRLYYVSPRSGPGAGLIPASSDGLAAHERLRGTASGWRRKARLGFARAGLGSLLHPRILVLGAA